MGQLTGKRVEHYYLRKEFGVTNFHEPNLLAPVPILS